MRRAKVNSGGGLPHGPLPPPDGAGTSQSTKGLYRATAGGEQLHWPRPPGVGAQCVCVCVCDYFGRVGYAEFVMSIFVFF